MNFEQWLPILSCDLPLDRSCNVCVHVYVDRMIDRGKKLKLAFREFLCPQAFQSLVREMDK